MNARLADRVARLQPSPTLAVSSKAKAMRAAGIPVVSLAAGEPDLPTAPHVIEAATKALLDGATRYTPVKGIEGLRQAIADDGLRLSPRPRDADRGHGRCQAGLV